MIYYLGYFDFQDSKIQRKYVVSATNKMEYIAKAITSQGFQLEFISLSLSNKKGFAFHRGQVRESKGLKAHFFPTCDFPVYLKWLKDAWRYICVFVWGISHLQAEDIVISYHTTSRTSTFLALLKKIKKFKLVLEVEEIYSDVASISHHAKKREYRAFANCDGYIFSTELLEERLNNHHKPYIIIYGTYNLEEEICAPKEDMIHIVYAGTFDKRKGGAAAAAAAAFLPPNYMMHICGFGKPNEENDIKGIILDLQRKGCNIKYDGLLKGEDYISLLQSCRIGLSTQDPAAKFNNTSFPSKILSYMSNGLSVVSIKIDAVFRSSIGSNIVYYDEQTPEQIAKSIVSVDLEDREKNRKTIASLDADFRSKIKILIERLR